MGHMAHAGDQNLGLKIVIVIDQSDVANQLHPICAIVIMAAHERRDKARTSLGRKQRLIGRKAQCDIDHCALAAERFAGLEAINRQRHFDADIVRNLAQNLGLFHHGRMIKSNHFGANGAIC